jgi:hypothetical protein
MSEFWQWVTTDKFGLLIFLAIAAYLEAFGDASWNKCLQGNRGLCLESWFLRSNWIRGFPKLGKPKVQRADWDLYRFFLPRSAVLGV